MDYKHWSASAKKLPWLAAAFAVVAILVNRNVAVVVVPAALGVFVAIFALLRRRLSIGQFLMSGWLAIALFFANLSAMVIAIARRDGLLDSSQIVWMALFAVVGLTPIATVYSSNVWKPRLRHLQMDITGPQCAKEVFFSHWVDRAQARFWASPAALSAMSGVAIFGSWVGHQYGESVRAMVVLSVLILGWVFLVGSGVAQLWHARRYREVLMIQLV